MLHRGFRFASEKFFEFIAFFGHFIPLELFVGAWTYIFPGGKSQLKIISLTRGHTVFLKTPDVICPPYKTFFADKK